MSSLSFANLCDLNLAFFTSGNIILAALLPPTGSKLSFKFGRRKIKEIKNVLPNQRRAIKVICKKARVCGKQPLTLKP